MNIRSKTKYWLYNHCPGLSGAFPYFGTEVYFPKNSFLFKLACEAGIFEHHLVQIISSYVKPNTFYFDVGANIGLMSVPILKHSNDCHVVSFEPSPGVLPFLQKSAANSCHRDRWTIIPKAIGSTMRTANFAMHGADYSAFDGLLETGRASGTNETTVDVTTIDNEWKKLGKPPVSVIKCDVEGGELDVIAGAATCIQNTKPVLVVEWNRVNFEKYNRKSVDLLELAESMNYRVISASTASVITLPCEIDIANAMDLENFVLLPL